MNKNLLGLMGGAVSAIGLAVTAHAAPAPNLAANSFEDLLTPLPNAPALLRASDEATENQADAKLVLVQDHHHHHQAYRPRPHHHHFVVRRDDRHHHHHHQIIRRFFER